MDEDDEGPHLTAEEREAVMAAADLAGRAGASGFRIGYDPGSLPVTWFAAAEYEGAGELVIDGAPDPAAAATALAMRILTGGKCKCGKLVALSVDGAWAPGDTAVMVDGSDPRALRDAGQCLWILEGPRWMPGCDDPPIAVPKGTVARAMAEHHRRMNPAGPPQPGEQV